MTALRQTLTDRQRNAADPSASVWVSANAGTGKTRVLTDRILRLLLEDAVPERILCLTFTKAAAAEMRTRLAQQLANWVCADDESLEALLFDLTGQKPDAKRCRRARQLFAEIMETPNGMKVQTIHSFCQSLLSRFPLEARLQPYFDIIDERADRDLLERIVQRILHRQQASFTSDLELISEDVWDDAFKSLMLRVVKQRNKLPVDWQVQDVTAGLARLFGISETETDEAFLKTSLQDSAFDYASLKQAANALLGGAKTDAKHGGIIAAWLASPDRRPQLLDEYLTVFFKADGEIRANLAHKAAITALPNICDILEAEAARLKKMQDRRVSIKLLALNTAFMRIASNVIGRYEHEKRAAGLLDYEDLIFFADWLLTKPGQAEWVLYKLDGGIDHVLIDEAQDTSPTQWSLIMQFADEFFAGKGQREIDRTIFAVGDPKQSIFSFQGADPDHLKYVQGQFEKRVNGAEQLWRTLPLIRSFRSTTPILELVDRVFQDEPSRMALGLRPDENVEHQANRVGQEGLVEIWPLVKPSDDGQTGNEIWALPTTPSLAVPPERKVARAIAEQIKTWIANRERLPGKNRLLGYGDILILVQRRSSFVNDLVREFKTADIPVSGVDRMKLMEQLAVMDLCALGRFLLLPGDDLSLAEVLKSPLFNIDDDTLFSLAYGREGSLWQRLNDMGSLSASDGQENETWAEIVRRFGIWRDWAQRLTPYTLYSRILTAGRGRELLLRRLGLDANDAINEFLSEALRYETLEAPSLQGFLHWIENGDIEVKRDFDERGDEVRIMTVHGSKGLQAPVVFLPDTVRMPGQTRETGGKLLFVAGDDGHRLPLWLPKARRANRVAENAVNAQYNAECAEHLRLLYVALTRAEDRLYITGWQTRREPQPNCWYRRVEQAMSAMDAEQVVTPTGPGLRIFRTQEETHQHSAADKPEQIIAEPLPQWFAAKPAAEPSQSIPLVPSRDELETKRLSPFAEGSGIRYRRGAIIHKLLEYLPSMPAMRRQDAAKRYLTQTGFALTAAQREDIQAVVFEILDAPAFSDLFQENSAAEVGLTGRLNGRTVSGRIDRLVVTPHNVKIVDYKSGQDVPASDSETPVAYLRQMAVYHRLLQQIYPNHQIEAYLLWTDAPKMMHLAESVLHASLKQLP